jgi:hypothetical protein
MEVNSQAFYHGTRVNVHEQLGILRPKLSIEKTLRFVQLGRPVNGIVGIAGDEMNQPPIQRIQAPSGHVGAESSRQTLGCDLQRDSAFHPASQPRNVTRQMAVPLRMCDDRRQAGRLQLGENLIDTLEQR